MNQELKIYLGSTSPFRHEILRRFGVKFEAIAPDCDEKSISGHSPAVLAKLRSRLKAMNVASRLQAQGVVSSIVIGADQVLGLNGRSFDKAETPEEATLRLQEFSGKTHYLHTGVCLVRITANGSCEIALEQVLDLPMTMRKLASQEIENYIASGEWQGCVGCYRIEGAGRNLFDEIPDDQDAIIGLPLQGILGYLD